MSVILALPEDEEEALLEDEEDTLNEHLHQQHGWGARKRSYAARRQKLENSLSQYITLEQIGERKIEKFKTTASYYKVSNQDIEIEGIPAIFKTLKSIFRLFLMILQR